MNKECCVLSSPKFSSAFRMSDVWKLESVNPKALEALTESSSVAVCTEGCLWAHVFQMQNPSAVMAAAILLNARNK